MSYPLPLPSISLPLTTSTNPQESPTTNPNRKPPTLRSRLSQLCKDGRLDLARRLFDSLPRPAPTILLNTLLIGYVCNSLPLHALHLYSLCPRTPSDPYTYSSALKACALSHHLRLGKSIHCHLLRRRRLPSKSPILHNSLLNMYASALQPPCIDTVRILFDRMPKRNVVAWNTLISWYVRSHRPGSAWAQFTLMLSVGVKPTVITFINIIPAVSELQNSAIHSPAYTLYALLMKHGTEYVNHLFVTSSAIVMFSEAADIRSARLVFDNAEERNIEVWNTMISAHIQNDQFDEGLALYVDVLESDDVESDTVTSLAALTGVSMRQDVNLGQQVHARLIKENDVPVIIGNALMVMYSRCGCVDPAFVVFDQMPERDVVSWNTMISALVQNGLDSEGLMLAYEMQKQGVQVDSVTVTALLSAASNISSLRVGRETHGQLIRNGLHCQGVESYLIDVYAKSGSIGTARRLFDGCQRDERDLVTWNAMIAGYMQCGEIEEAVSLFRMMLEEKLIASSMTISSILPACSLVGGLEAGRQIHGFAIRHHLDKNVFVDTALVDMYSKCGAIVLAETVFERMIEKNTVTYTTMLSGLGQHGFGERALSLFQKMQEMGTEPDAVTFVAVISACSYSGLVDEGLAVFDLMREFGIVASPEHHCCVVDLLGRAGRVEEAYEFVRELGDDGNFVGIWGSLLSACRAHGKLGLGELVSERLFAMNGDAGYHVLLSNVYAEEGKWDSVDRVRKEMREMGMRKEPGSSWIKVGDESRRFMSRDQKHAENDQIYAVLGELASEMKEKTVDPCLVDGLCEID